MCLYFSWSITEVLSHADIKTYNGAEHEKRHLAVLRVALDHPWTLPLPVLEKMVLPSLPLTVSKVGFGRNFLNTATLEKLLWA